MADTIDDSRVKDVPVSASACNADDWFLIDGETSGTRKLSAANIQKKLTSDNAGINISISTAGVIDVKNDGCSAGGSYAVALGTGCSALGRWAFAHGYNTLASGANSYSHAEGSTTSAFGNNSHAEGNRTYAAIDNSHSEGSGTSAFNGGAHAEGFSTLALGAFSHVEGRNTVTSAQGSHAEGYQTSALNENSHAEGSTNVSYGNASHAEGRLNLTSGYGSHAEGYMTSAVNDQAHSEGVSTYAAGNGSHAEGHNTYTSASYSHAEGEATSALNAGAHTEGIGTNASGTYSHAEGNATRTSGIGSHAEGYATSSIGGYSHAEGNYAVANAMHSHAEGAATSAMNQYSHVEGRYTISDTGGQHVEGQYNAPATGALHVIGNGTSTANRSNIIETYSDRVVVNGDLINDTLSDFMFDNSQIATGTKTCVLKLNTNDWYCSTTAYTDYNKKYGNIFSGDNFNRDRNVSAGYQYPDTIVCGLRNTNNTPVGIAEWKGDISKICWNDPNTGSNKNYVSSWPAQLPDTAYISTYERMFSDNLYVRGPDTVPTDLLEKVSASNINVQLMFAGCNRMSGNWDAWVSAFSAKSPSSYNYRVFRGCTGIDNYATYTANSALSSMFL